MRKLFWVIVGIVILGLGLFQWIGQGTPHNAPKKIGLLIASDLRMPKAEGLREGLPRYGLIEGQNVTISLRNAQDDLTQLYRLATELVGENVDVMVTTGTFETFAAKEAIGARDIPIIFVGVGCSVEMGLVKDSVNPGCNITGVDSHYVQLSGKRLEYLKRLIPDLSRVLVLYNPHSTPIGPSAAYLYEAAEKLNVELRLLPVTTRDDVMQALRPQDKSNTDAIMLMCSLLLESMTETLAGWSIDKGMPIMGVSEQQTEKGLLASYGLPYKEEGLQVSRIVSNVLRGQDPANIPVESPARLEFYLNTETARKLGVKLDPAGLSFVTKYIGGMPGGKKSE